MRTLIALMAMLPALAVAGEDGGFDHDHAALKAFLGSAVADGGVDYDDLASRRGILDAYVATLAETDISGFGRNARLAFWINAYNALTLRLILDEGQPSSIMDLDEGKVWKTRRYRVSGRELTLDDIEHKEIRPIGDGRIHAAVNCASKGCPPLASEPFTASAVESQLDAGARRWVRANAMTLEGQTLQLSPIFDWFAEDFAVSGVVDVAGADAKQDAAIHFIGRYGASDLPDLTSGTYTVSWGTYDWSLNKR